MLMADHGLVLYGNAIMVNPDFAKANPKVVAGFVRATIKGVIDTVKDPEAAIKSVMKRNETGDEKIELERLKMSLRDNFVTPWVKANGVGDVDMSAAGEIDRPDRRHLRVQEPAQGGRHLHEPSTCRRPPNGSCERGFAVRVGHARAGRSRSRRRSRHALARGRRDDRPRRHQASDAHL